MRPWQAFIVALAGIWRKALQNGISLSMTRSFTWNGYTRSNVKSVPRLVDAICEAYDRYTSSQYNNKLGVTYCNLAAQDIAESLGCQDLEGKLANEMIDAIMNSREWSEVSMEKAQDLANQGSLVFATLKEMPHGHICVVRPGQPKSSGKWGDVPSVMNVGKDNFISKGLNWAFADYPKIYVWRQSL